MFLSFHLNFEFILKTWIHFEFRGLQKTCRKHNELTSLPKNANLENFYNKYKLKCTFSEVFWGGSNYEFFGKSWIQVEFKLNSSWIQNNTISWPGFPKTPSNSSFTISANSNARFRRFSEGGPVMRFWRKSWFNFEFKMNSKWQLIVQVFLRKTQ